MTSSSDTPAAMDSSVTKSVQTAPPRKRRRRTAATGAAEDCFTCRKRQVRCDRRRPYCTQCLEIGKDCSGYRTTLTWGVGVASRGKLRGLSLPIVNSTKKAATSGDDVKGQSSPTSKPVTSPPKSPPQVNKPRTEENFGKSFSHVAELSTAVYSPSNYHPTSPMPIPIPHARNAWQVPGFNENVEGYGNIIGKTTRLQIRSNPLRRIHATATASYDEAIFSTPSTGSVSAFSDSDYPSPRDLPATPEDLPITEPYVGSYSGSYPDAYGYVETPRSFPANIAFTGTAVSTPMNSSSNYTVLPSSSAPRTFSDILHYRDFARANDMVQHFSMPQKVDQDYFSDGCSDFSVSVSPTWPAKLPPTLVPSGLCHLRPRMRFLLKSYDRAICPVLVAFDDDRNPYRLHVMRFIGSSAPLQKAVAALVTNQARMRGYEHEMPSDMQLTEPGSAKLRSYGEPTSEELDYKSMAIESFNTALKTIDAAADDSIFATLLVLCLLHLSDGGFGRFKTRVAGVKKLLAARGSSSPTNNDNMSWVEPWFTWFDVLASAVNDSESQVRSDALNTLDLSVYLGSLEHLASCGGRLFRLVARFGDLNLSSTRPAPARDFYSLPSAKETGLEFDAHQVFWSPLLDVRACLSSWVSHSQFPATKADHVVVHNISESFRHAGTIYAERQLSPHLAASAPQIQDLVASALCSIAAIPASSCINQFLLWPLLIVGTECTDAISRDIIRQRVITGSPGCFFNDFSCVDVLEKVWNLADSGLSRNDLSSAQESLPRLSALGVQAGLWGDAMAILNHESPK